MIRCPFHLDPTFLQAGKYIKFSDLLHSITQQNLNITLYNNIYTEIPFYGHEDIIVAAINTIELSAEGDVGDIPMFAR